jgi:hypothetical protein
LSHLPQRRPGSLRPLSPAPCRLPRSRLLDPQISSSDSQPLPHRSMARSGRSGSVRTAATCSTVRSGRTPCTPIVRGRRPSSPCSLKLSPPQIWSPLPLLPLLVEATTAMELPLLPCATSGLTLGNFLLPHPSCGGPVVASSSFSCTGDGGGMRWLEA